MIGLVKSEGVPGLSLWCCSVNGGRSAGCSMVGLKQTVEVLVCCIWRQIADIYDSGMSIPLSLFRVLIWSRIWIASFTSVDHGLCTGLHSSLVDGLHHKCALLSPSCQSA